MTLKALRVNLGWSLEEAAEQYGVSVDTIRNYEKFKTYPTAPIILKILTASKMKFEDIIFCPQVANNSQMIIKQGEE